MSDDDGLEITDEDRPLAAAMNIVPDREGIRRLLETYFVGPISEAAVDLIEKRFTEAHESRGQWANYSRHFQSPTFWQGKAWNEEFCLDRYHMTPRDLVLMLGNMVAKKEDWFPAPRLHAPAAMAGVWERVEPASSTGEPIVWHLGADGSFRTKDPDDTELATARLWSVKNGFAPGPEVTLGLHRRGRIPVSSSGYSASETRWSPSEWRVCGRPHRGDSDGRGGDRDRDVSHLIDASRVAVTRTGATLDGARGHEQAMKASEAGHDVLKKYEELAAHVRDVTKRRPGGQRDSDREIVEYFQGLYTSTDLQGKTVIHRQDGSVASDLAEKEAQAAVLKKEGDR